MGTFDSLIGKYEREDTPSNVVRRILIDSFST